MNTRRPPSRAKLAPAAPIPRSRSAMAKPMSVPFTDEALEPAKSSGNDHNEINIQVVIRCRTRSEREIEEKSPVIVTSEGAKSKEIAIEVPSAASSYAVVSQAPVRKYPFDLVFGPQADQQMIYSNVVVPMVDEVLMGYNCTLFAYGQTGTGKTYTMAGDLTPSPMGNPSAHAGIIPRVLFNLFARLEVAKADYSMKVSYVELYNEELRDLLATELSAPAGSSQPMGKNSSQANELKIYEDSAKRGVFIQGLEEIPVRTWGDALALLTKGSDRRQIAATKFNDHSSRSHSVFTITLHIKETSNMGDDLLKIGKLNLVDLAGSENIGRSGAENKRAREAGMINQSLLTLGRVINALVDKSQHVPYRESKLTRLLQDSLGGRTKTCIIATISPSRSNLEETLSTLDYALRAKSIRNKPELNQRMTRNSLIKEYIGEIERLKADLVAAREKSGIYFSEESWIQMSTENELRKTEYEEAKKQVEIIESQMRTIREEFEQSMGMLMKRESQLKETTKKLESAQETIVAQTGELKAVKVALEEEAVVRQAYQDSEKVLNAVATELRTVAAESIQNVDGLFAKLDRKSNVFDTNTATASTQGLFIREKVGEIIDHLGTFVQASTTHSSKIRDSCQDFETKELQAMSMISQRIDKQLQALKQAVKTIRSHEVIEKESLGAVQTLLAETQDTFKTDFNSWSFSFRESVQDMTREAESAGLAGFGFFEKALLSVGAMMEAVVKDTNGYIVNQSKNTDKANKLTTNMIEAENARLREQNDKLLRLLDQERMKSEEAKDRLLERVSGLLGDFTAERDRSLRETVTLVQKGNDAGIKSLNAFDRDYGSAMAEMKAGQDSLRQSLTHKTKEHKRSHDEAFSAGQEANKLFRGKLAGLSNSLVGSVDSQCSRVQAQVEMIRTSSTDALSRHDEAKRQRIEAFTRTSDDAESSYLYIQKGVASSSRHISQNIDHLQSEASAWANATDSFYAESKLRVSAIKESSQKLLKDGTKADIPTGTTPRKRVWEYSDHWELTARRDSLLKAWRGKGSSSTNSETFLAEHLPLPEQDADSDPEPEKPKENSIPHSSEGPQLTPPISVDSYYPPVDSSMSSATSSVVAVAPMPPPPTRLAHKRTLSGQLGAETKTRSTYALRNNRRSRI